MSKDELAKTVLAHKALKEFLAGKEDEAQGRLLAQMRKGDRIGVADDDDTDLGTAAYVSGSRTPRVVNETAFLDWVAANRPDEIIETVTQTVRSSYKSVILGEVKEYGGHLTETGEIVPVPGVEIRQGDPYLSVKTTAEAKERTRIALGATLPELTGGVE